ncbi:hypothetical protein CTI12_AA147980 [Artemisia annua]|uniref:AP-1 complex subunit gamma n=1 Tax=Artemisia annua TaxID=35608 RepID=A0A2U1PIK1_ARTAN|nr:hypothetical protein CTI12_AA147980 [Artemisia annua]
MDQIMNPFSSGTRLRDMIQAIRACKTATEERSVVRKECSLIRAAISDNRQDYSHRNLTKLMFIHMLGYPTYFGQMECLRLIAAPGLAEKRIGYLGLMLLFDERHELLMLATNSIKQDLNHRNQYIVGLALCALGNICSTEMACDLAPEVERLIQFRDPNVRKKAALCSIKIIKKVPELAENFVYPVALLLREKHHGVLLTGIQLCIELSKVNEDALEYFRKKCTKSLVRALKDVVNSPHAPEYDISGISDPFLHIRLLRILRVLGHGDTNASEYMSDTLAQVATRTDSSRNVGNAILYECVETILSIQDIGGLHVLAMNILCRFLSNRDNNIRYAALNMLTKTKAIDGQAVQRQRPTILKCVKDLDGSIRRQALELVFLLINESNVKPLTKELINYLKVSDHDIKEDLTPIICSIIEKFSSDKIWYTDQMLSILSEAGNYVKDAVWHAIIKMISSSSNIQGYSVRSLYLAIKLSGHQETLVKVAVWCIGEYGDMLVNNIDMLNIEEHITVTEGDVVDVVENAIKHLLFDLTTKSISLIALLKLSSRFPSYSQRIKGIITQSKGSLLLELQQRSVEFNSIIENHHNIWSALVKRMPVIDESTSGQRRDGSVSKTDMLDLFGPTYPSIVAYESGLLTIMFDFSKRPGSLETTVIEATFRNKSSNVYTDFMFQTAVPKFLELHLEPASSNTLPGSGTITQKLHVTNKQHGKKEIKKSHNDVACLVLNFTNSNAGRKALGHILSKIYVRDDVCIHHSNIEKTSLLAQELQVSLQTIKESFWCRFCQLAKILLQNCKSLSSISFLQ